MEQIKKTVQHVNTMEHGGTKKQSNPFSIRNDIVFKAVFGREDPRCRAILTSLLNALLDLEGEQMIQKIIYKNPFNQQTAIDDKLSIMDIKVMTEAGEWIDIEMQVTASKHYRKRSLYYWASLYKDSLEDGESFQHLTRCIVINIMEQDCITETERYHTRFQLLEQMEHFSLTMDLDIHFVQLSDFEEPDVRTMNSEEKWVTFLKDSDNKDKKNIVNTIIQENEAIRMAADLLTEVTSDEEMREMIWAREMAARNHASRMQDAREEGREEGLLAVARNMLALKLPIDTISLSTGLSLETIEKLSQTT